MLLRCMNCFNFKGRVPKKTVCFDCATQLFPNETFICPIPAIESDVEAKKRGAAISSRLDRAKTGLRLTDFPAHLPDQVRYRHMKRSLAKVGDKYYLNCQAKRLFLQAVEA